MNTENEYSLMKAVMKSIDIDTFQPSKEVRHAHKQINLRMFIINLNMRPVLPLPEELQMKIKHTCLMDQLKVKKIKKWNRYGNKGCRKNDMLETLLDFNTPCRMIHGYYKKELLHDMLDSNRKDYAKSWSVKRLLKEVVAM